MTLEQHAAGLAERLGVHRDREDHFGVGWTFIPAGSTVIIQHAIPTSADVDSWEVDWPTGLVALLALQSGRAVTRGCPDCAESSRCAYYTEGCPTCNATGRIRVDAVRLVCEAAHRECPDNRAGFGICEDHPDTCACDGGVLPGCPTARTELLAVAYGLDPGATDEERARRGRPYTCDCDGEADGPCESCDDPHGHRCIECGYEFCGECWYTEKHAEQPCEHMRDLLSQREPAEAAPLRDYLEARGKTPADLTPELLAEWSEPATEFGRVLLLWLSGAPCETCEGSGKGKVHGLLDLRYTNCKPCGGHGTACAARLVEFYGDTIAKNSVGSPPTRANTASPSSASVTPAAVAALAHD